ncbi:MAG: hypothetical protein LBB84_01460 [Tannerellaceae bacterium]|nr:hypothetical protein [Tannerellaceae bacterium]
MIIRIENPYFYKVLFVAGVARPISSLILLWRGVACMNHSTIMQLVLAHEVK